MEIKDMLIQRIPFLEEYEIFEYKNETDRLEAKRSITYNNKKVVVGGDIITFKRYNISSNVTYYSRHMNERTFHIFNIENIFRANKPIGMDDLTYSTLINANKQLGNRLSYYKEIIVRDGEGFPMDEFDKVVNDMNGILFKIEEFTKSNNLDLFKKKT